MKGPEIVFLGADRIAYRERGAGFPIVMLHSNSASSRMYLLQLESDLAGSFRLIAMDLPGHGDSIGASEPGRSYTLHGMAQSVSDFLEENIIDKCFLAGSSMGGNVALEVSAISKRIAGLLLIGSAPIDRKLSCAPDAFFPSEDFGLVFQAELSDDEANRLASRVLQGTAPPPGFIFEDIARSDGDMRRILGESLFAGDFVDEVELVAHSPVPLAVVIGENDAVVNIDYLRGLSYANLWRGEVQVIEGAGHAPQLQNPEAFNRLLGEFAEEVSAGLA